MFFGLSRSTKSGGCLAVLFLWIALGTTAVTVAQIGSTPAPAPSVPVIPVPPMTLPPQRTTQRVIAIRPCEPRDTDTTRPVDQECSHSVSSSPSGSGKNPSCLHRIP